MTGNISEQADARPETIAGRVAAGTSWLLTVTVVTRLLGLLNIVVLARILSPAAFGIVGMAMLVIELAMTLSDMQIANALLRQKRSDRAIYDTAFTFALIRGVITALAIVIAAWPAALYFGEPQVAPVIVVLALVPLIDAFRSPRFIEYARQVDYRREAVVMCSARFCALLTMVSIGIATRSYWALVAGTIAASVVAVAVSQIYKPYFPRWSLADRSIFLGFGIWMTLAAAVNYLAARTNAIVVGTVFSASVFGLFILGFQMVTFATAQVAQPFQHSLFAGLARIGDDAGRKLRAFLLAQATLLGLMVPVGIGIALTAREIVLLLAGAQWLGSVAVLQALAPILALTTISSTAQALLMADGKVRAIFERNLANLLVGIPIMIAGAHFGGFNGVLIASVINGAIFIALTLHMVTRHYPVGLFAILAANYRTLLASLVMLAFVSLVPLRSENIASALLSLVTKAGLGAIVYFVTLFALWHLAKRPEGFESTALRFVLPVCKRLTGRRGE